MRHFLFLSASVALSVCISAVASSELPPQASMDDMHGDCSAFSWDMSFEFSRWNEPAQRLAAATSQHGSAAVIALGTPMELELSSHAAVSFVAVPQRDRSKADTYSGLAVFTPENSGIHRVSASQGAWIDAVQNGNPVPSERFEMQTGCERIFKSIAFDLKAGEPVWLQINGNKTPRIKVLVSKWPAVR